MYKQFRQKYSAPTEQTQTLADQKDVDLLKLDANQIQELCCPVNASHPLGKGAYISQTNYRVKDPRRSLTFYTGALGMRLLKKLDFPSMEFSVYFLGYEAMNDIPADTDPQQMVWLFSRKAVLSLTHNWGTEDDDLIEISNGNTNPKGYGHIGICVPDVDSCCERLKSMDVPFLKEPNDGNMKGLAFVQDPDGYWVEILNPDNMVRILQQLD